MHAHTHARAQIFEAYGLGREVVDTAFTGSVSRIGGMSLDDIQRENEAFWSKGFPDAVRTRWLVLVLCARLSESGTQCCRRYRASRTV